MAIFIQGAFMLFAMGISDPVGLMPDGLAACIDQANLDPMAFFDGTLHVWHEGQACIGHVGCGLRLALARTYTGMSIVVCGQADALMGRLRPVNGNRGSIHDPGHVSRDDLTVVATRNLIADASYLFTVYVAEHASTDDRATAGSLVADTYCTYHREHVHPISLPCSFSGMPKRANSMRTIVCAAHDPRCRRARAETI
jgi:hypothetical protein